PRRRGRLYAEPQVRESRLEYDGVPDAEGRGDDHGGKRVRQDVTRENAQPARAHRDGAFDKRPRGERPHFAVDESRDAHPSRDAEDGDDEQRARLPERREQQKEYDPRQGQREIGEGQQRDRYRAAPVARDRAHDHSQDHGDQHREDADTHGDARPVNQPRPDVAAKAVGADRVKVAVDVTSKRRNESRRDDVALRGRIAVRDERRGDRAYHDHDQDQQPECAAPIPQQPCHDVTSLRTRGSSLAASRSASRLPATTSTALTAVAAMTTG